MEENKKKINELKKQLGIAYDKFRNLRSFKGFFEIEKKASNLSFSNQLLLWDSDMEFHHLETYANWNDKFDRMVKKGETSLKLLRKDYKGEAKILHLFNTTQSKRKEFVRKKDYEDLQYKGNRENIKKALSGYFPEDETRNFSDTVSLAITYKEVHNESKGHPMPEVFERIVREHFLSRKEWYNEIDPIEPHLTKLYQALNLIGNMIVSARTGLDIDKLYGRESFDEIFKLLNNNTKLFVVWTYAKEIVDEILGNAEREILENKEEYQEKDIEEEKYYIKQEGIYDNHLFERKERCRNWLGQNRYQRRELRGRRTGRTSEGREIQSDRNEVEGSGNHNRFDRGGKGEFSLRNTALSGQQRVTMDADYGDVTEKSTGKVYGNTQEQASGNGNHVLSSRLVSGGALHRDDGEKASAYGEREDGSTAEGERAEGRGAIRRGEMENQESSGDRHRESDSLRKIAVRGGSDEVPRRGSGKSDERRIDRVENQEEFPFSEKQNIDEKKEATASFFDGNIEKKDYWMVEYNELSSENKLTSKNYKGEFLTKELLDEIKEKDEAIHGINIAGEDDSLETENGYLGYYKFYFNHIVNGEVIDSIRVDLGDGNEINAEKFRYLYEEISEKKSEIILKQKDTENFHFKSGFESLLPSERLRNNLEAITMLRKVSSGEKPVDLEAKEVMAKYVGWGGLSEVFDEGKTGQWENARNFLKENLSEEEYLAARESTLTAFYTPGAVIDAIYQVFHEKGFRKGNILEPSCGIGNFIGGLPEDMRQSKVYAVEKDSISGKIATYIYPESHIEVKGFEEVDYSEGFFDIAVGNVPFGDFSVSDKKYNKEKLLIHDYFFSKTMSLLRTGGMMALITSSGTLDKMDDKFRKMMNEKCDFLGAIRLPNMTFKGSAGTDVMSDIIFLKKREGANYEEKDFIKIEEYKDTEVAVNRYFNMNPHMIIGELKEKSGRFGKELTCVVKDEEEYVKRLKEAIKHIDGSYEENQILKEENEKERIVKPADSRADNFSYFIDDDGGLYYRENSLMTKYSGSMEMEERIKGLVNLAVLTRRMIKEELTNTDDHIVFALKRKLYDEYLKFSDKFGRIYERANKSAFKEDRNFPLLCSLENTEMDGNKKVFKNLADIFFKRTIKPTRVPSTVNSPIEALTICMNEKGKVDIPYLSELTGRKEEELYRDLQGEIFDDLSEPFFDENDIFKEQRQASYVTKDEYLSGNVRMKLKKAEEVFNKLQRKMVQEGRGDSIKIAMQKLELNREELRNVIPRDLEFDEIIINIDMRWIPKDIIEDFIFYKITSSHFNVPKLEYSDLTGAYHLSNKSLPTKFDHKRMKGFELLENALNNVIPKIYDKVIDYDGNERKILNVKDTLAVQDKIKEIKQAFQEFIKEDSTKKILTNIYNEKYNAIVPREYDSKNLVFHGMNEIYRESMRTHQLNAIKRGLLGGNLLLAHAVGAGKTRTMIAIAMEKKHLGLCNKPVFVVMKSTIGQWQDEFMKMYPNASILVAEKEDFTKKNRKIFCSKIATGGYDAIIMTHDQFKKIPMSPDYQKKVITEEANKLRRVIKRGGRRSFSVKQAEKRLKQLESSILNLSSDKKDDAVTFEELGCDMIVNDESHVHKNLLTPTTLSNISGITNTASQIAFDMYLKTQYINEKTEGKGIIFATGTPVSNTVSELFTVQRYLQPNLLKEYNCETFDKWVHNFGEIKEEMELKPEGNGYQMKTKLSKYNNLPDLIKIFKENADVITEEELKEYITEIPEAKKEVIAIKPSAYQRKIMKEIGERAEKIRSGTVKPEEDNFLKISMDGRNLAIDTRLYDVSAEDEPNSKINACVNVVYRIWNETKSEKKTQLIFSDTGTPKSGKESEVGFDVYNDIKQKLIEKGVPAHEVAFIHDYDSDSKRAILFEKVNKGDIRVLIGSTSKLGTGVNVQEKLVAGHDLDMPWRPSDLIQREGRVVRQGNTNENVKIYRYVTEDTFDAYMWAKLESKQRFIGQIISNREILRSVEDIDKTALDYAEIKALCTSDTTLKETMEIENRLQIIKNLRSSYRSRQNVVQKMVKEYPEKIEKISEDIRNIEEDIKLRDINTDIDFSIVISGKSFVDKKEAATALIEAAKRNNSPYHVGKISGEFRGFHVGFSYDFMSNAHYIMLTGSYKMRCELNLEGGSGNITRLENTLKKLETVMETKIKQREVLKDELKSLMEENNKSFSYDTEERNLRKKLQRLQSERLKENVRSTVREEIWEEEI